MGMNITVNRQKLIDQLKAKLAEIDAYYVTQKAKLEDIKASMLDSSVGWADWYEKISEGLRDGHLVVDNGRLKGALTKDDRNRNPVPDKPGARSNSQWGFTKIEQVEQQIEQLEVYYKANDQQPYIAALALLELSEDDTITIDGSDYNQLLAAPVGRNFRW